MSRSNERPQEDIKASTPPVAFDQPSAAAKVRCPVCCEQIEPGARHCIHCSSDLTWRRHLHFSNTTLALLTALIAVLGTLGPKVAELLDPRGTRIQGVFVGDVKGTAHYSFLATNRGAEGGVIRGGGFHVDLAQKTPKEQRFTLRLRLQAEEAQALFLSPHQTQQVVLYLPDSHDRKDPTDWYFVEEYLKARKFTDCNVAAYLEVVNADGTVADEPVALTCEEFAHAFLGET
jgi:hypothetical protein